MSMQRQIDKAVNGFLEYESLPYALELEALYIDYFNDFLTREKFAEHYHITPKLALIALHLGRSINKQLRG